MKEYDSATGLPIDKLYLECSLPQYLRESVENMKRAWEKIDKGEQYYYIDCDYCSLQSDINCAEVDNEISSTQANYLRVKYLRLNLSKEEDI